MTIQSVGAKRKVKKPLCMICENKTAGFFSAISPSQKKLKVFFFSKINECNLKMPILTISQSIIQPGVLTVRFFLKIT